MIYKCNNLLRNCKFVNSFWKTLFNNDKKHLFCKPKKNILLSFEKAMLRVTYVTRNLKNTSSNNHYHIIKGPEFLIFFTSLF